MRLLLTPPRTVDKPVRQDGKGPRELCCWRLQRPREMAAVDKYPCSIRPRKHRGRSFFRQTLPRMLCGMMLADCEHNCRQGNRHPTPISPRRHYVYEAKTSCLESKEQWRSRVQSHRQSGPAHNDRSPPLAKPAIIFPRFKEQ